MLDESAWQESYAIAYGLHLDRAACELVVGRFEDGERLVSVVLERAKTPADRAAAYSVLVDLRMTQGDGLGAGEAGLEGLRACGVEFPEHVSREDAACRPDTLGTPPRILGRSAHGSASSNGSDGLCDCRPRSSRADTDLVRRRKPLCAICQSQSAREPRMGSLGSKSVVVRGLCTQRGRHHSTLRRCVATRPRRLRARPETWVLGHQAPRLLRVRESHAITGRTTSARDSPYLELSLEASYQQGALTYLCYAENHLVLTRHLTGREPGASSRSSPRSATKRVREYGYDEMADLMESRHLLIQSLRGETNELGSFSTQERSEDQFEEHIKTKTFAPHAVLALHRSAPGGLLRREFREGRRPRPRAAALLHTSVMYPFAGEHAFYFALSLAATMPPGEETKPSSRTSRSSRLRESNSTVGPRAVRRTSRPSMPSSPPSKRAGETMILPRCATTNSPFAPRRTTASCRVQAIAYELAARFYASRGFMHFADVYLREARRCVFALGRHGEGALTRAVRPPHRRRPRTRSLRARRARPLTVTQASQALSSRARSLSTPRAFARSRWCAMQEHDAAAS